MHAVIIANGTISHPAVARTVIQGADLIIAADGGLHHCQSLEVTPDVLIGDFDSLELQDVPALARVGVLVEQHPTHKDATDLELALDYALAKGARRVSILGGVGTRWDQSLANLLLPASKGNPGTHIRLLDGPQEAILLQAGETLRLQGEVGDTVSLIPLLGDAQGISTAGLAYPLENGTLSFGSTRGVSNTLISQDGRVYLREGALLVLVFHGPLEGSD